MHIFNSIIKNPKGIKFESQEKGEHLYFILRQHPITNLGWILFAFVLLILPSITLMVITASFDNPETLAPPKYQMIGIILWYMFTMIYAFESFLIWYFSVYIITEKRIIDIDFHGLWHKRVSEAAYDTVEDVTYRTNSIWNILFDFGDIFVQTAGQKREFDFHRIPNPALIHDKLTDLVELYKKTHK